MYEEKEVFWILELYDYNNCFWNYNNQVYSFDEAKEIAEMLLMKNNDIIKIKIFKQTITRKINKKPTKILMR